MLAQPALAAFELIPDPVFIVHPATLEIAYANCAAEQITGLAAAGLQQLRLPDLHPEHMHTEITDAIARLRNAPDTPIEYRAGLVQAEGSACTVAVKISHATFEQQLYLLAIARDITEQCQQLQENTTLYHSLVAALSDLMFRITRDGIYRDFHIPETSNLTSPPPETIIGKHVRDVVPQDVTEAVMPAIEHVVQTGTIGTVEYSIEEADGLRHYEARFVPSIADEIIAVVRDITQRKRETDALRDSEKMARMMLNASGDSAILIDRNWNILAINDTAAERLGHTPDDMLNKPLLDYFPPQTAETRKAFGDRLLATKQPVTFTDTRDNHIFHNRASPILDERGEVVGITIFARDITRQEQHDTEIKHQNKLFRAVAEAARCLLAPGHYKQAMTQAIEILGVAAQVDRIIVLENRPDPETGAQVLNLCCLWQSATLPADTKVPAYDNARWVEKGFRHSYEKLKAGEIISGPVSQLPEPERSLLQARVKQLSVLAVPIFVNRRFWGFIHLDDYQHEREWTDAGINVLQTLAASLGSAIARYQIESSLRQETQFIDTVRRIGNSLTLTRNPEEVLEQLLIQIRSVIPYNTASAQLLDGNTAYMVAAQGFEQFGFSKDDLPFTHIDVDEMPYMQIMRVTHDPYASPDVTVDPNWLSLPGTFWIKSWLGAPIVFNGETHGFLSLDSTEKGFYTNDYVSKIRYFAQQAAIALRNARYVSEIEDLERVKSEIIRIASHDLRTPLTRIRNTVQRLRNDTDGELTPKQHEALQIMLGATRDMNHIITNILSLERIEAQQREAQPIYWNALIDQALAGAEEELRIHAHALSVECPLDLPVIRGNPFKLERAVYNLIHNAIKYTPPGGHIQIRAQVRPYGTQDTIAVEVEDDGIGIPPEKQEQLFKPFYRVQQLGTEHIPGTGLGLAMTKTVIEEHNGNIYFDSIPGQGSLFGFWVPV